MATTDKVIVDKPTEYCVHADGFINSGVNVDLSSHTFFTLLQLSMVGYRQHSRTQIYAKSLP